MMIPKKREISGTAHLATKDCPNYSFRAWALETVVCPPIPAPIPGRVIIEPVAPSCSLGDLVARITPQNRQAERNGGAMPAELGEIKAMIKALP